MNFSKVARYKINIKKPTNLHENESSQSCLTLKKKIKVERLTLHDAKAYHSRCFSNQDSVAFEGQTIQSNGTE